MFLYLWFLYPRHREGNTPGRNMGPGQGGSRSEWGWEEGNIKGGHWARAREGPRTISPKKGQESFISDSSIIIMKRCSNIMKIELSHMNDSCPFFGEIVLGPSLAWAQWPPLIFPSSQPHSDRDPPWPGPIFLLMVCPSLYYLVAAYIDTLTKER